MQVACTLSQGVKESKNEILTKKSKNIISEDEKATKITDKPSVDFTFV